MTNNIFQVMPTLTDDEYAALRDDIATNGVIVPIVKDQHGRVLDGHHRLEIAAELEITNYPIEVREIDDDQDGREIAYTLNLARRHLTSKQKRALIAAEIEADPDRSDRAIGRMLGVDHKTVGSVRRELAGEIPHHDDDGDQGVLDETEEEVRAALIDGMNEMLTGDQRAEVARITASIAAGFDAMDEGIMFALSNRVPPATIVGWLTMQKHNLAKLDHNAVYLNSIIDPRITLLIEDGQRMADELAGPDVAVKPLTDDEIAALGAAISGAFDQEVAV